MKHSKPHIYRSHRGWAVGGVPEVPGKIPVFHDFKLACRSALWLYYCQQQMQSGQSITTHRRT